MRGPGPGFHHHGHCGWGVAGAMLGAAVVRNIVRPAPVVVAPSPVYAPTVYAPTVYAPPPVVVAPPPVIYAPPPPPPPPPCRFW